MTDEFADQLAIVDGSFDAGMSAEVTTRQMTSLSARCLAVLRVAL